MVVSGILFLHISWGLLGSICCGLLSGVWCTHKTARILLYTRIRNWARWLLYCSCWGFLLFKKEQSKLVSLFKAKPVSWSFPDKLLSIRWDSGVGWRSERGREKNPLSSNHCVGGRVVG